ncbi:MAG TPA: hypothetical protein VFE36_13175 [Candidatus Baltobacteraceae bacterium]|jgi:hypothetical protein|nr:hypothetical protein [Candidatus Baltobacteraceae bacterium]
MRVAAFREQPHANQVASILQEQGYEYELVELGGSNPDPRSRDLCEAMREAVWATAFLISNCELDHFEALVKENFGDVVFNRRMRWAS